MSEMSDLLFHKNFIFRSPCFSIIEIANSKKQLEEIVKRTDFQEAIYISSPSLYSEMLNEHNGENADRGKSEKLEFSVFKYLSRMSSRGTPYGLFAFCSSGNWESTNEIIISEKTRRTRLDMSFVSALAAKLSNFDSIRESILFFPNNSIYKIGGRLRFVEYKFSGSKRIYETTSVDNSEYLIKLLNASKTGKTIFELSQLLVDKEISFAESNSFVNEIITSQLLVSELEPFVTGKDVEKQLLVVLKRINTTKPDSELNDIIGQLERTNSLLRVNDLSNDSKPEIYRNQFSELSSFKIPIEENHLFQVDSFGKTSKSNLNTNVQEKILKVSEFLQKLSSSNSNGDLQNFKNKFLEIYENSEVSLLELLDTETGIGYPSKDVSGINKLIDDVFVNRTNEGNKSNFTGGDTFLLKKLIDGFKNEKYTVNLNDKEVEAFIKPKVNLPPTLVVMFKMIDSSTEKIQVSLIGGGSSAANLLGRFAYENETIHEIIKDITVFEQKLMGEKIIAEIVHLPESRIGNILFRPVLREHEIPYLGKSGASLDKQILVEDLFVSIRTNRVILRSKRLNKEIIPRLSSAHNYSFNSLPVYKFLCDLQLQDIEKPSLVFSWGSLAHTFSFLPRAEYGDVVLFPATWNLSATDYSALAKNISKEDFITEVKAWQEKWKMPRWIVLKEGDNELLVDFENELSIKTFFNEIKKRPSIQVSEFLFDPENALVKDEKENPYTNEIIAIVFNNDFKSIPSPDFSKYNSKNKLPVKRSFIPGSEWLYYKIYCGVKTADDILATTIKPLIEQLSKQGLIEKWFFIRYADPDTHIRLRFFNNDPSKLNEVSKIVSQYLQPFHEQGIIPKIQTDTYTRELERYGNTSIELAEDYFSIDSWATLNFLQTAKGDAGEDLKWQFAIKSVDDLMDGFSFSQEQKFNFIEILSKNFIAEHSTDKSLKVQLDNKFRKMRAQVNDLFENPATQSTPSFAPLLEWKKNMIQPIANQILKLEQEGNLEVPLNDLLASFLHMTLNRIFKAKQRTHEMVIYDLLHRYYKSKAAKEKNIKAATAK